LNALFKLYNYYFSKDKELARRLYPMLGFVPSNLAVFKLAFAHKSTYTEKDAPVQNNERLEFLGDAVLGSIVAEYLFKKYPNADEGFLTKMRSKIVKRKSLNKVGEQMGLDMLLSEYNPTRLSRSMMGNAVESLVGAVYLDLGYEKTQRFVIRKILRNYVDVHELEHYDDNYKSQLLEWCQKNGQTVSYKLIARYKFDKRDRFKVAVLIDDNKVATAEDFNKKSAEQLASEKAMQQLGILTDDGDDDDE
jgi:ribonuclease III